MQRPNEVIDGFTWKILMVTYVLMFVFSFLPERPGLPPAVVFIAFLAIPTLIFMAIQLARVVLWGALATNRMGSAMLSLVPYAWRVHCVMWKWGNACLVRRGASKAVQHVRAEVAAARRQVDRFHRANRKALVGHCPRPLIVSRIKAEIPMEATAPAAWEAAANIISSLQPIVAEYERQVAEQSRRDRERSARQAELTRQIGQLRHRIDQLRRSPLDNAVTEEETLGLEMRIRELETQRELLAHAHID